MPKTQRGMSSKNAAAPDILLSRIRCRMCSRRDRIPNQDFLAAFLTCMGYGVREPSQQLCEDAVLRGGDKRTAIPEQAEESCFYMANRVNHIEGIDF